MVPVLYNTLMKLSKNVYIFLNIIFFISFVSFFWFQDVRYGFTTVDYSFQLGTLQRLKLGYIPHKDFFFGLNIGSLFTTNLIHFFLENYNFQITRIMTLSMYPVVSYFLLNLSNNFKNKNEFLKLIFTYTSAIANLHFMYIFSFYTIDGIFFIALGSYLIFNSKINKTRTIIGFLFLSLAISTKLVYLIAVFFIVFFHLIKYRHIHIFYYSFIFLFQGIYIFWIALNNAIPFLVNDLRTDFALPYRSFVHHLGFFEKDLILISILLVGGLLAIFKNDVTNKIKNVAILFLYFCVIILNYDFSIVEYRPFTNIFNFILIAGIFLSFKIKNIPTSFLPLFIIYFTEASAMVSQGYRWGQWLIGLNIIATYLIIDELSHPNNNIKESRSLAYLKIHNYLRLDFIGIAKKINSKHIDNSKTILIIILISVISIQTTLYRIDTTYYNFSKNIYTTNLYNLNPIFGNIYTTPEIYDYLDALEECIDREINKKISVFPDNPQVAYLFDLDDPLPLDWFISDTKVSSYITDKIISKVENNNDFIIFLQSYKVNEINKGLVENQNVYNNKYINSLEKESNSYKIISSMIANSNNEYETCSSFRILRY
jgi:hypothetical protein